MTLAIKSDVVATALPQATARLALGLPVSYSDGIDSWACFDDNRIDEEMRAAVAAEVGDANVQLLAGIPEGWTPA